MTHPNVPAPEVKSEPDPFAAIATELRKAADDIATLVGSGLPKPTQFMLNIQPGAPISSRTDDATAEAVDAMAGALLGIRGKVQKMSGGSYFYCTDQQMRGPLVVTIYQSVSTPWALKNDVAAAKAELAEREADLEKARARVAELERARKPLVSDRFVDGPCEDTDCPNGSWPHLASSDLAAPDPTGLNYTRADTDDDDPTPVSPARVPSHAGGVEGVAKPTTVRADDGGVLVTDPDGCE